MVTCIIWRLSLEWLRLLVLTMNDVILQISGNEFHISSIYQILILKSNDFKCNVSFCTLQVLNEAARNQISSDKLKI